MDLDNYDSTFHADRLLSPTESQMTPSKSNAHNSGDFIMAIFFIKFNYKYYLEIPFNNVHVFLLMLALHFILGFFSIKFLCNENSNEFLKIINYYNFI